MKMTAPDLLENHVVDKMFTEPKEGLEENLQYTTSQIIKELEIKLPALSNLPVEELLDKRYKRFRQFGEYTE